MKHSALSSSLLSVNTVGRSLLLVSFPRVVFRKRNREREKNIGKIKSHHLLKGGKEGQEEEGGRCSAFLSIYSFDVLLISWEALTRNFPSGKCFLALDVFCEAPKARKSF